jgi:hypothetical protein
MFTCKGPRNSVTQKWKTFFNRPSVENISYVPEQLFVTESHNNTERAFKHIDMKLNSEFA